MPRRIDTQAVIDSVRLEEQASDPSTPASGYGNFYTKDDGLPYYIRDDGTVIPLVPTDGWVSVNETWTYASADDPTYTFTISGDKTDKYSAGMKLRLSQSTGGTKYFIVTKVAYGAPNTTMTIYGGTDYDLANEAISSPNYSLSLSPYGFPLDISKWTVEVTDTTLRTQSTPTQNTWYNPGSISISIPIGVWRVYYEAGNYLDKANSACSSRISLSTSSSSESDTDFTAATFGYNNPYSQVHREKTLNLTSKTTYYLIQQTQDTGVGALYLRSDKATTHIRAECAYL